MFLAVSTRVPALFARFVDDAAVFPPGSASLPQAVADHHRHRAAWYADLVGPLLVPVSELGKLNDVPLMMEHLKTAEEYQEAAGYIRRMGAEAGLSFL